MLVQFGNNWIQKIPLTAKLDSAYGLVQFWLSSEFFSSNYFQIGQHVVLLHILIGLHAVQFGNNWIQKIPLTAKLDSAYGLVQVWLSEESFESNYFQIGQACSPLTY